jgi:dihydropyrimidinase
VTTIIKGGTVVSTTGADRAEVLVDGEIIVALLLPGSDTAEAAERGAEQVIDATGKIRDSWRG